MKSVSLVLGSGGARGLAHLGVIDWLVEHDYAIESISGCSIGAMVGGIYAAGKHEEFKDWIFSLQKSDVIRLTDIHWGAGGLVKGDRVMNALRDFVGDHRIEDLPIKFTAIATELKRGQEKWFQHGDLFQAIRASVAVPNVMSPQVIGERVYVDGGLLNPIPITPTLADHTDTTIAVSLGGSEVEEFEHLDIQPHQSKQKKGRIAQFVREVIGAEDSPVELPSMMQVTNRSFDIMQTAIGRTKLASSAPDVLVELPRNLAMMHEFWRAEELAVMGYKVMGETMKEKRPVSV